MYRGKGLQVDRTRSRKRHSGASRDPFRPPICPLSTTGDYKCLDYITDDVWSDMVDD